MIISISNWEKYNPRRRGDVKSSSWFRLQHNFITDPDFYDYSSDQKMIWICLLSEASAKMSAEIRINPSLIASLLKVSPSLVLATVEDFQKHGFISIVADTQRIRSVFAANSHSEVGATNERTNERTDIESPSAPPPSLLFDLWTEHHGALPKAARLTAKRRDKAAARLRDEPSPVYWTAVIQTLARSSFATGKNDRGWKADFDWLVANDTNHVKVAEGKYDDRKPTVVEAAGYTVLSPEDLDDL